MAGQVIKGLNRSLQWISDLLSLFQRETITIPADYRSRVLEVKKLFNSDGSGLVSSMLDFAVSSAQVDYKIESDNDNLEELLNNWMRDINISLLGKVPTGLNSLAKEYFRERWKGSSNLLLRTFWEEKDGLILPTVLFFVDGEDIKIKSSSPDKIIRLGDEQFYIRTNSNDSDDIKIPTSDEEMVFSQRPFETWGSRSPVPFIIKRGLFKNMKFADLLDSKAEFVLARAIEYLFVMKKGTEKMALEGRPEFTYSEEDLKGIRDDLKEILMGKKSEAGTPTYTTNFDTEMEHLIPEYERILSDKIYSPIEKKLLYGLGLVNIVEGVGSTRRESIINPKPFMEEIRQGVKDFKSLMFDLCLAIKIKNKIKHPKWMNASISIFNTPLKPFMTDKFLDRLRSLYDRGRLSSRTLVEVVGDMDYNLELQRRKRERENREDDYLYPPVTQNLENNKNEDNDRFSDRNNPVENKNFDQSDIHNLNFDDQVKCKYCEYEGSFSDFIINIEDTEEERLKCPSCDRDYTSEELFQSRILFQTKDPRRKDKKKKNWSNIEDFEESEYSVSQVEFEQAPYNENEDLPKNVKVLPSAAQTLWRKVFNNVLSDNSSEDMARRVAWSQVKKLYRKKGDKWIKKTRAMLEKSNINIDTEELLNMQKIRILSKKEELIDKLLKEEVNNENI